MIEITPAMITAAEAQEAHLDAFLDHLINVIALRKDYGPSSPAVQIERKLAKHALRDAISARS